jgi:hypothetical protein
MAKRRLNDHRAIALEQKRQINETKGGQLMAVRPEGANHQ